MPQIITSTTEIVAALNERSLPALPTLDYLRRSALRTSSSKTSGSW